MALIDKIEHFGYTMEEWGVAQQSARLAHTPEEARKHEDRAEQYRIAASTLRTEIKNELDISNELSKQHMAEDENKHLKVQKLYEQYKSGKMTADDAFDAILTLVVNP